MVTCPQCSSENIRHEQRERHRCAGCGWAIRMVNGVAADWLDIGLAGSRTAKPKRWTRAKYRKSRRTS